MRRHPGTRWTRRCASARHCERTYRDRAPMDCSRTRAASCRADPWRIESPTSRRPEVGDSIRQGSDRKSTRLNSSHTVISYAVFCLKKKKTSDLYQNIPVSRRHGGNMLRAPNREETQGLRRGRLRRLTHEYALAQDTIYVSCEVPRR